MGWTGSLVGCFVGGLRGGFLGSLLGSFVGHCLEEYVRRKTGVGGPGFRRPSGASASPARRDPLADAYRTLGVRPDASDEEVRRAYRQKARKYHPDTLRAQGLPDDRLGRATELMAQVNAAWTRVRAARGL